MANSAEFLLNVVRD